MNSHERINKGTNLEREREFVANHCLSYTAVYTPHAHIKKNLIIKVFKPFL